MESEPPGLGVALRPPGICLAPGRTWPRSTAQALGWGNLTTSPVPWGSEARPPRVRCPQARDSQPGDDRLRREVADLFRLSGATSRQRSGGSAAQQQGIDALIAWRPAQLGGQAERCPPCGCARSRQSACQHRHGPPCQMWPTAQGVAVRPARRHAGLAHLGPAAQCPLPSPRFGARWCVSRGWDALGAHPATLPLPWPGFAHRLPSREPPRAVAWRRQRTGIDITQGPHCGSRPLVRQPLPLSHRSGAEPRGPPAVPATLVLGGDLGARHGVCRLR